MEQNNWVKDNHFFGFHKPFFLTVFKVGGNKGEVLLYWSGKSIKEKIKQFVSSTDK